MTSKAETLWLGSAAHAEPHGAPGGTYNSRVELCRGNRNCYISQSRTFAEQAVIHCLQQQSSSTFLSSSNIASSARVQHGRGRRYI
jgi:hypothetical protein